MEEKKRIDAELSDDELDMAAGGVSSVASIRRDGTIMGAKNNPLSAGNAASHGSVLGSASADAFGAVMSAGSTMASEAGKIESDVNGAVINKIEKEIY